MPLFISLMRFQQKALDDLAGSPARGKVSAERVAKLGGRSIAMYATMGPYDFVQIFEMPDHTAMMEYVTLARRDGYVDPLILPAFDTDAWRGIVEKVTGQAL